MWSLTHRGQSHGCGQRRRGRIQRHVTVIDRIVHIPDLGDLLPALGFPVLLLLQLLLLTREHPRRQRRLLRLLRLVALPHECDDDSRHHDGDDEEGEHDPQDVVDGFELDVAVLLDRWNGETKVATLYSQSPSNRCDDMDRHPKSRHGRLINSIQFLPEMARHSKSLSGLRKLVLRGGSQC